MIQLNLNKKDYTNLMTCLFIGSISFCKKNRIIAGKLHDKLNKKYEDTPN